MYKDHEKEMAGKYSDPQAPQLRVNVRTGTYRKVTLLEGAGDLVSWL